MKLEITNIGKDIILHSLEGGASPAFTAIVYGNGSNAGLDATEVSNLVVTINLSAISREDGSNFVKLSGILNNANITDRFRANEVGVMCMDPDDETGRRQVLFAYAYVSDDEAAVIPAATDYAFETLEDCIVYVGEASDVTAIISASAVSATKADLEAHAGSRQNPHEVSAEQVGLGNVQNATPENMTPVFEEAANNGVLVYEELTSGSTFGVLLNRIATAIKGFISHIANFTNPHKVSYSQTGAARSLHYHNTSEITSGILSVARGGTGCGNMSDFLNVIGQEFSAPVFGSYTGNGSTKRLISLPFTPSAVLLLDSIGMAGDDVKGTCGGLAVGSAGVTAYGSSDTYSQNWNNDYTCLMITTNGFYVNYSSNNSKVRTNTNGIGYRYIAWR